MAILGRARSVLVFLSVGLIAFATTTAVVDAHVRAAGAAVRGGGGGGGEFTPAGNYTSTFVGASMCCGGLTITVDDSTSTSQPQGGPRTLTKALQVSFNICDFDNNVCGNGCFVAGDGDFTFASDLSSAALKTTYDGTQAPCPPPFGGPAPSFSMPSPAPTSFTLTATWTSLGAVASDTNVGRYMCSGYTSETSSSGSGAQVVSATTQISLDPVASTFGPGSGFLNTFNQTVHAQGTPAGSCNPVGGKGAGQGPQPRGSFQSMLEQASVTLPASGPSATPWNVSLTSFVSVSTPLGGTSTTAAETDLTISTPFFPPEQGCFVLTPDQFTITSSGVSVHAAIDIDGGTQQCQFFETTGLPDEFKVDITWSANGALATFRSNATFSCPTLISASSGVQTSVNAGATGQLTGLTDPFNAVPGILSTNSSSIRTVKTPTC